MEYAFMTEPQAGGTYEELLRLARWAENAGFDAFTRSDHYLDMDRSAPATDALTTLAGLGRETEGIKLVVLVTPLTFRHPGVIAKVAATIDEMSAGRLELGVGTGWMDSEHEAFGFHFPPWTERFARLEETLAYLHAAFGRREGGHDGSYYRLADITVLPRPTGRLPMIIGGGGPLKTPILAGRYGDELNMFWRRVDELIARRDVMRAAAADAGRDPDAIKLSLMGDPLIGDDRADYRERLQARLANRGWDSDWYKASLLDRGQLVGTVDEVMSRLERYEAVGVSRIYIQIYTPLDEIDTADAERTLRLLRD